MNTHMVYMTKEHRAVEMVTADVAYRLYAACLDAKVALEVEDALYFRIEIEACKEALAVADGEDV